MSNSARNFMHRDGATTQTRVASRSNRTVTVYKPENDTGRGTVTKIGPRTFQYTPDRPVRPTTIEEKTFGTRSEARAFMASLS